MNNLSSTTIREATRNIADSAIGAQLVTLGTPLPKISRWIYIGAGGNLLLTFADGTRVLHKGLIAGATYRMAVTLVEDPGTGTAAADIIAHF